MKILIVDDQEANRLLPAVVLSQRGHAVAEADSGEAALAWLAQERPDCVLLDISMPGLSGEDVCRRIRADERLRGVRLVAYTAHAMPEEGRRFLAAGFDDVLIKPISLDSLFRAVAGG